MFVHEVVKILLGVFAAGVLVQQVIEVVDHVVDPLTILVGGPFQSLLHAGEALVEHLAAEQIPDLVVLLARLVAAPAVLRKLLHGFGRRRRQRIQRFELPGFRRGQSGQDAAPGAVDVVTRRKPRRTRLRAWADG